MVGLLLGLLSTTCYVVAQVDHANTYYTTVGNDTEMYAVFSILYQKDVYVKASGSSKIKLLIDSSYHKATKRCQGDVRKFTIAIGNKSCINDSNCPYFPKTCGTSGKCNIDPYFANSSILACLNIFMPESARAQYKFDTSTDVSEYTQTPASNSCSDDEYSNVNGGLCTFLPQGPLFSCGSKNHTQTGICFTNDRSDTCQGEWKRKSTNQLECESKGQYCEHYDGTLSLLNETSCTGCSGKLKWRYKWTGNSFNNTFRPANVTEPRATAKISIVRQLCRNTVNGYQKYLYTFVNLFKAYACNCVAKTTNCIQEMVSLPQDDCMVNPSNSQKCGGFTFDPSKSKSTAISNVAVFRFSSANFINNATTMPVKRMDVVPEQDSSHVALVKRCNPLPAYEIVYSSIGGSVVGQIIGDGIMMKSSSNTYSEASICLAIDQSIPTNKVAYQYYDIGYVMDNKVYPQRGSVKVDGLKVCGTVYDFPEIVYIPILRKNY